MRNAKFYYMEMFIDRKGFMVLIKKEIIPAW